MSEASRRATLSIRIADFAATDAAGKLNLIGGGITGLGYDPVQAVTSRFTVVSEVMVPVQVLPADASIEVALLDDSGEVVELPGAMGEGEKMRVAQVVHLGLPGLQPSGAKPPESVPQQHGMILDFGNGLPLKVGGAYQWRLSVDGDVERAATYAFFVQGPPPAPVVG